MHKKLLMEYKGIVCGLVPFSVFKRLLKSEKMLNLFFGSCSLSLFFLDRCKAFEEIFCQFLKHHVKADAKEVQKMTPHSPPSKQTDVVAIVEYAPRKKSRFIVNAFRNSNAVIRY